MDLLPLVSIGIPNYNYSRFILQTLDSIEAQEYANIEITIVDDCSTDNSIEVIESWIACYRGNKEIHLIRNEKNIGLTKVCNLLLKEAKGKYFQPLDADDIIMPGKINSQVKLLEENMNAALVYSNAKVINENGEIVEDYLERIRYNKNTMPSGNIFEKLLIFNFVSLPTILMRTNNVRSVGGFDESLQIQDYYMWLKLAHQYEVLYLNEFTAKYRIHNVSMSATSLTSAKIEESVMNIKYKYYNQSNSSLKVIIKTNIQNSSVYLYQNNYPSAKKWLTKAFILKPGVKTFCYFIFSILGIPFVFVKKIKSIKSHA